MIKCIKRVSINGSKTTLLSPNFEVHRLEIEGGRHIRPMINRENRTCKLRSHPGKQALIEDEVHFITRCDNFMQMKTSRNEFFNEIMLPRLYRWKTILNTDKKEFY